MKLFIKNHNMKCPILDQIINKCRSAGNIVGDHDQLFLPLCSLHQICHMCLALEWEQVIEGKHFMPANNIMQESVPVSFTSFEKH
ncbi:hypothetical protein C0J52_11875 [Blattella germanica]|nr:hypothetical protein C0J52_11875 [Blattella germanica]